MEKIKFLVDLVEEQFIVDGILVDGKHVLYSFENIIWFAPYVINDGEHYIMNKGEVMLCKVKNSNLEENYKELLTKLKSITLFEYFTLYHDLSLDYDFNLL
ncbi:hypothetical protein [Neobacillus cucumis]|uniref:Uncharacterized protein n=1 Tax=Neobacillus cucumis TaxID=1740721 RepID=A0A2N5HEU3_9BACI|nr:hypothetical protein [Neobacillus cucumis]PLS04048.1 hypothetical protein CVD27_12885 [Neobacillus cucumis]